MSENDDNNKKKDNNKNNNNESDPATNDNFSNYLQEFETINEAFPDEDPV
jgi:hypothetical protein